MIAAFLITLREGVEAALIVGIVLASLRRLGETRHQRAVWAGVATALVLSVGAALALNALGLAFTGRGEALFEGAAMILAAGVLTWMVVWMRRQGRQAQSALERDTARAVEAGHGRALFALAWVAVLREGIETVLFMTAAAFGATPEQTLTGAALGLAAALILGWLVFHAGKRVHLRLFFRVTGIVLLLMAAGLLAHGLHELQEAALVPTVIDQVWNMNPVLDESGVVGGLLKALFGYNGNPSLVEVIVYALYLVGLPLGLSNAFGLARKRRVT